MRLKERRAWRIHPFHLDHLDAPLPLPSEIKGERLGTKSSSSRWVNPPQKKAAPNKGENKPQNHPKAPCVARFSPAPSVSSS